MTNNIASYIDHTLLKAEATKEDIKKICEEAKQYKFASVCVNPTWVKFASSLLGDSDVKVCTVIGFPLGANTTETKEFEAKNAIENGATEIDMVINIGALKAKQDDDVKQDISRVCNVAKGKAIVKVIIETSLLSNEEKERACEISKQAGADFVKTSTGFSTGGATIEDVQLMRRIVGNDIGVKASGGVRNLEDLRNMIDAGASRIGASAGVAIMQGLTAETNY
nr:deoxyribose-phosphate aldolase [Paenibacillus bovis]